MILYHHYDMERSTKKYIGVAVVVVVAIVGAKAYMAMQYSKQCGIPRASCREHLEAGCANSGNFTIANPHGTTFKAYCDQKSDQGGWMLVLNYNHRGGTNPALNARKSDLPLSSGSSMGTEESGSENWGHAAPEMMKTLDFSELRFHCQVADTDRLMDFKTTSKNCISYFKTGKGDCSGINSEFTALPGHTAKLPKSATGGFKDKGDYSMREFPSFLAMQNYWGIHGLEHRWEWDDYRNGEGNNSLHQIFVR